MAGESDRRSRRNPHVVIAPGGTIGILGGGQLGRMLAIAAAPLGYRCHIFSPEPEGPAAQVSAAETVAAYDDRTALDAFGAAVDVVTVEFENVPASALERLRDRVPVRPGARSLQVAQNRISEKGFVRGLGLETTPYAPIEEDADAYAADPLIGRPAVLKTQTLGYDGKGQVVLAAGDDLRDAWYGTLDGRPAILEALVAIEREVSVVVARAPDGGVASFDPVENRHVNGILDLTLAPADVSPALAAAARAGAERVAQALDHVGALCVELFVTVDGQLLVNEIAPRVHNSGHWTIERVRDQPVRTAHPRRLRPSSGPHCKARQRRHEEPDRRRCRALADARGRPGRAPPSLRQG